MKINKDDIKDDTLYLIKNDMRYKQVMDSLELENLTNSEIMEKTKIPSSTLYRITRNLLSLELIDIVEYRLIGSVKEAVFKKVKEI